MTDQKLPAEVTALLQGLVDAQRSGTKPTPMTEDESVQLIATLERALLSRDDMKTYLEHVATLWDWELPSGEPLSEELFLAVRERGLSVIPSEQLYQLAVDPVGVAVLQDVTDRKEADISPYWLERFSVLFPEVIERRDQLLERILNDHPEDETEHSEHPDPKPANAQGEPGIDGPERNKGRQ
jgi:hypothetical protein